MERYPVKEDVVCTPGKWMTIEGYLVHEAISCTQMVYFDLNNAVIHRSRQSPVHASLVEEIGTKCTIGICQLMGNSDMERCRYTNSE